jgi:S-adenosylmethionine decarboxylase
VTGLVLLSESHLAVHTFTESRLATFSFFCCRPCADWPWDDRLREQLGAQSVVVRSVRRGGATGDPAT